MLCIICKNKSSTQPTYHPTYCDICWNDLNNFKKEELLQEDYLLMLKENEII